LDAKEHGAQTLPPIPRRLDCPGSRDAHAEQVSDGGAIRAHCERDVDLVDAPVAIEESLRGWKINEADRAAEECCRTYGIECAADRQARCTDWCDRVEGSVRPEGCATSERRGERD
jgi:hypothetical protein